MSEVTIIGIDLAKRVFQLHGALSPWACATAHGWGREFEKLGHDVRLIPPIYVKPLVKRQKTDAADAEAIVEAALRPPGVAP